MATAPIKSQPLHNFSLPHLRWAHKNSHHNHHHHEQQQLQQHPRHSTVNRFRRRDSPEFDDSAAKPSSRTPHKPQPFYSSFSSAAHQNQKTEQNDDVAQEGEKLWNLRPRKVVVTTTTSSFRKSGREKEKLQEEDSNNNNSNDESNVLLKSSSLSRLRGTTAFGGAGGSGVVGPPGFYYGTERQQRKVVEEKRKLWISLSKEEIEEDVYSLTGSRPSRRPKKRPRNVQKQLDSLFPGLYFVGMSVDSYRGHDSLR